MNQKGILSTDENRIDPNIDRKRKIFDGQLQTEPDTGRPLFAKLELSVTGLCSRRCVFCPRVDPKVYPNVREHLSESEHRRILNDLAEVEWRGTISYSGFGEPMLHPHFDSLIATARETLPDARLETVTNGDFLDSNRLRRLVDAGIDVIIVSLYDGPGQLDEFSRMRSDAGVSSDQMLLRIRYKPPEKHHGLTISNRAGTVDLSYIGIEPLAEPMSHPCFYPHYSIFVEYDGEVLLCCNDWTKQKPLGNVHEAGLLEIWFSPLMDAVRSELLAGNRQFSKPCRTCNVKGTRMGGLHAEAWTDVLGKPFYSGK